MKIKRNPAAVIVCCAFLAAGGGCSTQDRLARSIPSERRSSPELLAMEVTAYCPCGHCCNWRRDWRFRPVIASGPHKGRPKAVGVTASGTRARPGTVAADPAVFPFGTLLYIPGYGYGRVEDTGGAIRGRRLDLYYDRHGDALRWGRRTVRVSVWRP